MAVCLALVVVALGECSGRQRGGVAIAAPQAHIEVVNRTDYSWSLAFARSGLPPSVVTVTPRGTVAVNLTPGDYQIEQRADGESVQGRQHLALTVSATLLAGQRYRWPLLTLLSAPASQP